MIKYIPLTASLSFLGLSLVALPAHATNTSTNAGAWSSVDVHQEQTVTGISPHVHMEQNAETLTSVRLGHEAAAISHQVGHQEQSGKWAKGHQEQDLHSGADIQWQRNVWPSWTTAHTTGSVDQHQSIWSDRDTRSEQHAFNEQASRVGRGGDAVHSTLESEAHQQQRGGRGDVHQQQGISGATHAEGHTSPPFPDQYSFRGFGGSIRQFVSVTVENILNF